MKTSPYEDFSRGLHQRLLARRLPVHGTIEVTHRCPLACGHCYNNLPPDDQQARRHELTYNQHCRILDEIAAAGCLWLLYTGGEIFVRQDFLDIYTYAKQKGLLITLFTNGILINENIARVRVFLSGELTKPVTVKGLAVTKGAREAIEKAGGKVEE